MDKVSKKVVFYLAIVLLSSLLIQFIFIGNFKTNEITGTSTSQGQVWMCIDGILNISNPLSDQTIIVGNHLAYDFNLTRNSCFLTTFTDGTSLFDIDIITGIFNFTANSSDVGSHSVTIWTTKSETLVGNLTDSNTFTITINSGVSNISMNHYKSSSNKIVEIYGTSFSGGYEVSLYIANESESIIYGPVSVSTNSSGAFNITWNTTLNPTGNYTIAAVNLNTSTLNKNITLQIEAPFRWDGAIFDTINDTPEVVLEVYLDEDNSLHTNTTENYTLDLDYGTTFTAVITPVTLTTITGLTIKGIFDTGNISTLISIDDVSNSTYKTDFSDFTSLFSYNPGISNFEYINVTMAHAAADSEIDRIYKCADWNFGNSSCNDDTSWVNIKNLTDGATSTTVTIYPGDPGLGVGPDPTIYCGNGVRDYNEQCDGGDDSACVGLCLFSCSCSSAATTTTTTTASGGSGGGSGGSIVTIMGEITDRCRMTFVETFDGDVTEIQLHLLETYCNSIAIWKAKAKGKIALPEGSKLFTEFKIGFDYEGTKILDAVIRFKIPKTWLKKNGIEKEGVKLFDLSNGEFFHLSTILEREDADYVYYISLVKNYDHIAIIGSKSIKGLMLQIPIIEMPIDIRPVSVLAIIIIVLVILGIVNFYLIIRKKDNKKKKKE